MARAVPAQRMPSTVALAARRRRDRTIPADATGRLYAQFVNRTVAYLPMPKKTSKLTVTAFAALADLAMAARVVHRRRTG
jgi:hypothetical protein